MEEIVALFIARRVKFFVEEACVNCTVERYCVVYS